MRGYFGSFLFGSAVGFMVYAIIQAMIPYINKKQTIDKIASIDPDFIDQGIRLRNRTRDLELANIRIRELERYLEANAKTITGQTSDIQKIRKELQSKQDESDKFRINMECCEKNLQSRDDYTEKLKSQLDAENKMVQEKVNAWLSVSANLAACKQNLAHTEEELKKYQSIVQHVRNAVTPFVVCGKQESKLFVDMGVGE